MALGLQRLNDDFLLLALAGVRRQAQSVIHLIMWLMRIPPTATPPNLTDGSLYSVMLPIHAAPRSRPILKSGHGAWSCMAL